MDIRRNHRDLTGEQKRAFVTSILRLKNDVPSVLRPGLQNRYDDFVQVHRNSMGGPNPLVPNPHQSPLFYPWHRILIRQFELALKAAANDPSITLPYWDWQLEGRSNPFTADFMGGNGDNMQNQRVTTGPFSVFNGAFELKVWDDNSGDQGLRRDLGANPEQPLPGPLEVISTLARTPYWQVPVAEAFGGWENVSEDRLHNRVHAWIGGDMTTASSSNDPLFFLHHCHLDFLWEQWRQQHPISEPFQPRADAPNGVLDSSLVFNPPNEPAPWPERWTVRQTLDLEQLDYRYE